MDLEAIFQNEDLSGLVFESRSRRNRGFDTIEELIQTEFERSDCLEASQAKRFASERSLLPGTHFQDAEYKMQLRLERHPPEPAPPQTAPDSSGRPGVLDPDSACSMVLEGRDSFPAPAPQSSSKPQGFQPKKKQRSKIEINQQVKKSLRKSESEKRQFSQQLQQLVRSLSIGGRASHFAFVSRDELQLDSSGDWQTRVRLGPGPELFARNSSCTASSSFNFRQGLARLAQACGQALRPFGRESFTDTQRFCKLEGLDSCENVLGYFDEGVLLNIVLNRKVAAPDPAELLHVETFCAGGLEALGGFVAGEVRSMVSELKSSVFGVAPLHALLDEVFHRIRSALLDKENLGLPAASTSPEEDASTPKAAKSPRVRSAPNLSTALLPSFYFP